MTYTKYEDIPNRREPLSGRDHIQHIEDGLEAAHEAIDDLESSDLEFSDIGGTASSDQIPSLAIAKITGLQDALDEKADADHDHAGVYATPAQVNAKADANHGHDIGDVSGLQDELDAKSDTGHGHAIADVTGLQDALDGKAATSHTHSEDDITGLSARLSAIEARLDALEEPE